MKKTIFSCLFYSWIRSNESVSTRQNFEETISAAESVGKHDTQFKRAGVLKMYYDPKNYEKYERQNKYADI